MGVGWRKVCTRRGSGRGSAPRHPARRRLARIAALHLAASIAAGHSLAAAQGCDHNPAQLDTRTAIQLPQRADPERPVILKSDVPSRPARGLCGTWQRAEAKLFVKLRGGSDQRIDWFVPLQDGRRLIGTAEIAQQAEPLEVVVYFDARGRQPVSDPIEMVGNTRNAHVIPLNQIRFFQLTGGPQLAEPHIELMSVASARPQHRLLIVVCPGICSRGELDEIRELESKLLLRRISEDARGRAAERKPEPPSGALATHPPARPLTPREKRAEEQRKQQEARESRAPEEQERERRAGRPAEPGAPPTRPGELPKAIARPGAVELPPGQTGSLPTPLAALPERPAGVPQSLPQPAPPPPRGQIALRFFDPRTGEPADRVRAKAVRGACGNRDMMQAVLVGAQGGMVGVHGDPRETICIVVQMQGGEEHCLRLPRDVEAASGSGLRGPPRGVSAPVLVPMPVGPASLCPPADPWKVRFLTVAGPRLDPELAIDLVGTSARLSGVPLTYASGDFQVRLGREQVERLTGQAAVEEVDVPARLITRQSVAVDPGAQMIRITIVPRVLPVAAFRFEFWQGEGPGREANQRCELALEVPEAARIGAAWQTLGRRRIELAHEGGARYVPRLAERDDGRLLRRLLVPITSAAEPAARLRIVPLGEATDACRPAEDLLTAEDFETQVVVRNTGPTAERR